MAALTKARYDILLNYISGAKLGEAVYPSAASTNEKRFIRQQAPNFEEREGVLFYRALDDDAGVVVLKRVVYDRDEKLRLIKACHHGVDGGHMHLGRDKTTSKV